MVNETVNKITKRFQFDKIVYLTDTNAMGNVYFAKFFEWQGMAREEFFRELIPDYLAFMKSGTRLITVEASMEYKHEALLFDQITISVKPQNVKRLGFDLSFTFTNKATQQIIGVGRQRIAFADANGKLITIPSALVENGKWYLDPEDMTVLQRLFFKVV